MQALVDSPVVQSTDSILRDAYTSAVELERRACETSYSQFIRSAWRVLEPGTPLIWNWHLDVLCDEVQKQIDRIGNREPREYHLVVNVPPRSLKSWIFTRAPTAWAWIKYPWLRFMTVSYAENLALDHASETRTLIKSDWYQERWGDRYQFTEDQDQKSFYRTDRKGYRMTGSVGGKAIGRGGHIISIDDPISPEEAESEVERDKVIRWYSRTIKSRLNNPTIGMFWLIMQRLHEEDLTGHVLRVEGELYKHYCLPAEDGPQVRPVEYRSKYINGLLSPELFPRHVLDGWRSVDSYMYAGQYQQIPSPEEGGLFKRQWWRFWKPTGMQLPAVRVQIGKDFFSCPVIDLPDTFDDVLCSWDAGMKDRKGNDPWSGQVWAKTGSEYFLLDESHGVQTPVGGEVAILDLYGRYSQSSAILIEDTSGGSAVLASLRSKTSQSAVIGISTGGASKRIRSIPMSRAVQAGNVYLPHPAIAKWVDAYIDEFSIFDHGQHDDRVDAADQAINYWAEHRRVWSQWRGGVSEIKIPFDDLSEHSTLIVSQWVESDMTSSALMAMFSRKTGSLYVYDEYVSDHPRPEQMVSGVLAHIRADSGEQISSLNDLGQVQWWVNKAMIAPGSAGGDLRDSYRKLKVNIRSQQKYTEQYAIIQVTLLMARKALFVDKRCGGLAQQMSEWGIKNKEPETGHGLCRALCQLSSVLVETGIGSKIDPAKRSYSRSSSEFNEGIKEIESSRPGKKSGLV
jgi:predicted phage terminase large subunit-like protein